MELGEIQKHGASGSKKYGANRKTHQGESIKIRSKKKIKKHEDWEKMINGGRRTKKHGDGEIIKNMTLE